MRRADSDSDISDDVEFSPNVAGASSSTKQGGVPQCKFSGTPRTDSSLSMSSNNSSRVSPPPPFVMKLTPTVNTNTSPRSFGSHGVGGGKGTEEVIEEDLPYDHTSRALDLTQLLELDATTSHGATTTAGGIETLLKRLETGDLSKQLGDREFGPTFTMGGQTFTLAGSDLDGFEEIQPFDTVSELLPCAIQLDGTNVLSAQALLETLRHLKAGGATLRSGHTARASPGSQHLGSVTPNQFTIGRTPEPGTGGSDIGNSGGFIDTLTGQLRRMSVGSPAATPTPTPAVGLTFDVPSTELPIPEKRLTADELQFQRQIQQRQMKKANNIKRREKTPESSPR